MAISVPKAPSPFPIEPRQHLQNSPWSVKRAVLERWMAAICWVPQELRERTGTMLLLLLTAAAVSMTADDRACLRAFFRSHMFLMFCVLVNTTSGCALAWMAVTAPMQAARRSYAESTVASFVLLAVNLHSALSNLQDVGDAA